MRMSKPTLIALLIAPLLAVAQDNRQEFGVAQGRRAFGEQFLSRPIFFRPFFDGVR